MTPVVVDASIALDLYTTPLGSPAHMRAIALFKEIAAHTVKASVPDHFSIECASGVIRYQRRNSKTVTQANALEFLNQLDVFQLEYCGMVLDARLVGQWATAMNCGAYDAVYLQLARQLDAHLASSDKAQRSAALAFNIALWEPGVTTT